MGVIAGTRGARVWELMAHLTGSRRRVEESIKGWDENVGAEERLFFIRLTAIDLENQEKIIDYGRDPKTTDEELETAIRMRRADLLATYKALYTDKEGI